MEIQKINSYNPNFQAKILINDPKVEKYSRESLKWAREQVMSLTDIIENNMDRTTTVLLSSDTKYIIAKNPKTKAKIQVKIGEKEEQRYSYLELLTKLTDPKNKNTIKFWGKKNPS